MTPGWRAHVTDDPVTLTSRVILWQPISDHEVSLITSATDHVDQFGPTLQRVEVHKSLAGRGLVLPTPAIHALAELLRPGPASAEVARLEEALAIERRRVDDVLGRHLR